MDYLVHNIAINLNHIRKAKGMSLDVVAEQTGVSKSMLAAIEKGAANPSIGVLGKIMSGLRIELTDLTQAPRQDADEGCRGRVPRLDLLPDCGQSCRRDLPHRHRAGRYLPQWRPWRADEGVCVRLGGRALA